MSDLPAVFATPQPGHGNGMSEQNNLNLIRRYVDGELDAEQAANIEQRLESDAQLRARVHFEHLLRQRVDAVMRRETAAPPGLAERISAALSETSTDPQPEVVVGRVDSSGAVAGRGKRSRRIGPSSMSVLAIAAALILIAGAIVFSIFGPQIPDASDPTVSSNLVTETARFVENVHIRCESDPKTLADVSPWQTREEAEDRLTDHLGDGQVSVLDLSALGYEFIGAGKCRVPGPVPSGHFFHKRPGAGGQGASMVSLYVVPDKGQYADQIEDYRLREWFELPAEPGSDDRILGISNGSIIYFLVCPCHPGLTDLKEAIAAGLPPGEVQ
jgi:anti-sigma factor RsiW